MMIPTMSDYATYLGDNLATFQNIQKIGDKLAIQTKTKSFRIEDILDIRDQQDDIYTGVRADCEVSCFDDPRLDGKRTRGPRKDRTIFSKIQLFRLERRFHDQKYLSSYEKALIAHSLQLTQQQVQTWFQNRRAKAKREEREKKKHGIKSPTTPTFTATTPTSTATTFRLSQSTTSSSPITPTSIRSPNTDQTSPTSATSMIFSASPRDSAASPRDALLSARDALLSPRDAIVSPVMRLVNMCTSVGSSLELCQTTPSQGPLPVLSTSSSGTLSTMAGTLPTMAGAKQSDAQSSKQTNSFHRFSIHHLTSSDASGPHSRSAGAKNSFR